MFQRSVSIVERLANSAGVEVQLRITGMARQQFLASHMRLGRPVGVARYGDRTLRSLDVRRIEQDSSIECGESGVKRLLCMAARAEQEPRVGIPGIAGARPFEEGGGLERAA